MVTNTYKSFLAGNLTPIFQPIATHFRESPRFTDDDVLITQHHVHMNATVLVDTVTLACNTIWQGNEYNPFTSNIFGYTFHAKMEDK